ncbi:hypothetical protein [Faunimonas pinastri]|nr:hypothetical protein [Faunimonas pinastri]
MQLPRLIGICGNPRSGKSEAQRILKEQYGVQPVDDGFALRHFAVRHLGLSWEDVQTQEGKARYTDILGGTWQNREILGELGNKLEGMFGEHIMPFMATRGLPAEGSFSFGSVRKLQGEFFRAQGGVVIEISNPLAPPSPYDFDWYSREAVNFTIENDALARGLPAEEARLDLAAKIHELALRMVESS